MICADCGSSMELGEQARTAIHRDEGPFFMCVVCDEARERKFSRLALELQYLAKRTWEDDAAGMPAVPPLMQLTREVLT
jgi:hypothetical protein